MWTEFVGSVLCSERFFSGYAGYSGSEQRREEECQKGQERPCGANDSGCRRCSWKRRQELCQTTMTSHDKQDTICSLQENLEMPNDWKHGHQIKLPKKENLKECSNWRGITLLSVPGKVFSRILLERIKTEVEKEHVLRDEQTGFRQERSTTDQIATLRNIIEQSLEWNTTLYTIFVDFEKVFDSVDRDTLWKLLAYYGIPEKIMKLIRLAFANHFRF